VAAARNVSGLGPLV